MGLMVIIGHRSSKITFGANRWLIDKSTNGEYKNEEYKVEITIYLESRTWKMNYCSTSGLRAKEWLDADGAVCQHTDVIIIVFLVIITINRVDDAKKLV